METVDQFVNELIKLIPELNKFFEETRNYWYPKNAPLTLFFSDLAREIIELNVVDDLKIKLFSIIELGVSSSREELGCAVATGFLETYYFTLEDNGKIDDFFWKIVGEKSKQHIVGLKSYYDGN